MDNTPKSQENTSHDYYILNDDGSKSPAYKLNEMLLLKTNEAITKDTLVIKDNETPKPAGAFLNFDNDDIINTSGTGHSARLPKELNTYNIGAGILSIFWGYNHFPKYRLYWGTFIVLFCLNISFFFYYLLYARGNHPSELVKTIAIISDVILMIMIIILPIITFIFLIKGNELAWQNRKFKDIEQFKDVQKKWNIWGYAIFILFFMFYASTLFYMYFMYL